MRLFTYVIFLATLIGCSNQGTNEGDQTEVYYIDLDTDKGTMLLSDIASKSFEDMTTTYGQPETFVDMGSYFFVRWENILIRKRGTDFWCTVKFRYDFDNEYTGYSLWKCDPCEGCK